MERLTYITLRKSPRSTYNDEFAVLKIWKPMFPLLFELLEKKLVYYFKHIPHIRHHVCHHVPEGVERAEG